MTVATSLDASGPSIANETPATDRRDPLTVFAWVYFFSGFSSLVYQVVWQRALSTHFGVGPISTTVIVSVFMAGLGIGSYLGGVLSARVKDCVTAYFTVELLLGVFGACSLAFLNFAGGFIAKSGFIAGVGAVASFLLIPTVLMGITFPLLTQIFVERDPRLGAAVSRLYFVNTLGAAFGALTSSVVLISFFGLDTALYVAAATNLSLAIGIQMARRMARQHPSVLPVQATAPKAGAHFPIAVVFVTGFLAIGYQMLWFRMVGILVKDSPYAFSGILATYLLGIACGSLWVHRRLERGSFKNTRALFFGLQVGIGVYAVGIALLIYFLRHTPAVEALLQLSFGADTHPPKIAPGLFTNPTRLFLLFDVFLWSLLLFFPATVLMGAAFPLAPLLINRDVQGGGSTVGKVYFLNVAGNVAGGVVTGFFLLPALGTDLTLLSFTSANLLFLIFVDGFAACRPPLRLVLCSSLLLGLWQVGFGRGELVKALHPYGGAGKQYFREGVEGTVLTYVEGSKVVTYLNGQRHGGRPNPSFYVEAIETAAFARSVERVLFIGYGTGSTMEALLKLPNVKQVVLVELNATLMQNLQQAPMFQELLSDPRIELHIDDGRQYLNANPEAFDLVLLDPLRTATAYSNNLYSREFFSLVARHLRGGGLMMLWQDEFDILPRTVASVFAHVRNYSYFLLASDLPFMETPNRRQEILRAFDPQTRSTIERYVTKQRTLRQGFDPARGDEHALPALRAVDGGPGKADTAGPINTDWKPLTEYYLGWSSRKYFDQGRAAP